MRQKQYSIRLDPEIKSALEHWMRRQQWPPSRSIAVNLLLRRALKAEGELKPAEASNVQA